MFRLSNFIFVLTITLSSLVVASCKPRGETQTLSEILKNSRDTFVKNFNGATNLNGDVKSALTSLLPKIDKLSTDNNYTPVAGEVADALTNLVQSAGYTSRPAMGELIQQLQVIATDKNGQQTSNASARALLSSRIFWLLASELEGIKFGLKERESKL